LIVADFCQVLFVLHAAFAITGIHHGTGQHAWNIQPSTEIPIGLKVSHWRLSLQSIRSKLINVRTGGYVSRYTCFRTWHSRPA
jgi:hypothetical protein